MSTTITVGGNTYTLVSLPSYPCFSDIALSLTDNVAIVESPYIPQQSQTQAWPGGDAWAAQVQLPPMDRVTAAAWKSFMAECRGMMNVFQLGDQSAPQVLGDASQNVPLVDGTSPSNNPYAGTTLFTKGWKPNQVRLLTPADYLQIGYRLHMVVGQALINSDASGNAQIPIFPSLRETPPDGTPLILNRPVGLFRMAQNKRDWHTAVTQFTAISFKAIEVR
jgi:hypothetical protein